METTPTIRYHKLGDKTFVKKTRGLTLGLFLCGIIFLLYIQSDVQGRSTALTFTILPGTGSVTTGNVTTGNVTTGSVTTGDITTGNVTTGSVTTGDITTGNVTTGSVTTGNVTTGSVTTGNVTTGNTITSITITSGSSPSLDTEYTGSTKGLTSDNNLFNDTLEPDAKSETKAYPPTAPIDNNERTDSERSNFNGTSRKNNTESEAVTNKKDQRIMIDENKNVGKIQTAHPLKLEGNDGIYKIEGIVALCIENIYIPKCLNYGFVVCSNKYRFSQILIPELNILYTIKF